MKRCFLIILCAWGLVSSAQVVLERQSISCFASNGCTAYCIYSTGGQVDYNYFADNSSMISAGFEQPFENKILTVEVAIVFNECTGLYDANVTKVAGCEPLDTVLYFWNGNQGIASCQNLSVMSTLDITSSGGCSFHRDYDFSMMDITSVPCELTFYSYVSPNGDGKNDEWIIKNITDEKFLVNEVMLMNRWGNVVWKTMSYNNQDKIWKGTSDKGEALPDGTYFYMVKTNGKEYKGYVELIR